MKKYILFLLLASLALVSCDLIEKEVEYMATVNVVNTSKYDAKIYFDNSYRGSCSCSSNSTINIRGYYDRPISVQARLYRDGSLKYTSDITKTFNSSLRYKITITNSELSINSY